MKKIEHVKTDKFVDAFYTGIASQMVDDIITETDALKMPEFDFTEMDSWFENFHDESVKKQRFKSLKLKSTKMMRFAAIALISIGIGFSTLMMSVEAFRVSVFNLFVSEEKTHTLFEQVQDDMLEQLLIPYPRMMPKGFQLYSFEDIGVMQIFRFADSDEGEITLTISSNGASIQLNTEDAETMTIELDDIKYTYIFKDDIYQFFWNNKEWNFNLRSNISKENTIKIINSIK